MMLQGLGAVERALSQTAETEGLSTSRSTGAAVETSFSEALASAGTSAVDKLQGAEGLSLRALQGEVETREVVDAVMNAEQTLQASIAIRDKIVTAYLEVSRMPI